MLQEAKPHDLTTVATEIGSALFIISLVWKFGKSFWGDHKSGEERRNEKLMRPWRDRAEAAEHLASTREQLLKDVSAEKESLTGEVERLKLRLRDQAETETTLQSRLNTMRADVEMMERRVSKLEGNR